MKKSEFRRLIFLGLTELEGAADRAVILAEEAGIAWEPEEAPLPTHLEFNRERGWLADKGVEVFRLPQGQREAIFEEATRRFNAWPELRALADCLGDDGDPAYMLTREDRVRRNKLLAILDGAEPRA